MPVTGTSTDGQDDAVIRESAEGDFWMEEHTTDAGGIRLGLIGELDVAGADHLRQHLHALSGRGEPVLLDLSRLQFIDSSGLGELVRAVSDARLDGRTLEIGTALSPQVRRIIELLELDPILWPTT
jgi:anti-anti-sigma factor